MRYRRNAPACLLVALLASTAGCGDDRLDTNELEQPVAQSLADATGRPVDDLDCAPAKLSRDVGTAATCSATIDGASVEFGISLVEGGDVSLVIDGLHRRRDLAQQVSNRLGGEIATAEIDCGPPDEVVQLADGEVSTCSLENDTFAGATARVTSGEDWLVDLAIPIEVVARFATTAAETMFGLTPDSTTCDHALTTSTPSTECALTYGDSPTSWTVALDDDGFTVVENIELISTDELQSRLTEDLTAELGEVAVDCGASLHPVVALDPAHPAKCTVASGAHTLEASVSAADGQLSYSVALTAA